MSKHLATVARKTPLSGRNLKQDLDTGWTAIYLDGFGGDWVRFIKLGPDSTGEDLLLA